MPWGEAAAEQHEKDQPSTCLRPDGAEPEMEPIRDRADFMDRAAHLIDVHGVSSAMTFDSVDVAKNRPPSYHEDRARKAAAHLDQLVLMRARQIVEEADERRRKVMDKLRTNREN